MKKYEQFTQHNLDKYLKLNKLIDKASPSKMSICIIHIGGDEYGGGIIHPNTFKELDTATQNKILNDITVTEGDYSIYTNSAINDLKSMEIHKILKEFADLIR